MSEELIYIYCIAGRMPEIEATEDSDDIYTVFYRGLYVMVSRVSSEEFNEDAMKINLNDMMWLESKVRNHERVIEKVMDYSAAIPFKFATIFKTEDSLKAMVENYHNEFRDILARLEGHEEWGVKVYCDMQKFKSAVVRKSEHIMKIEDEIKSSGIGKAYFLNKKKEEFMDDIASKEIIECRMEIHEALQKESSDAHPIKLLPKEVTGRKDKMILNAVFLLAKPKLEDFIESIDSLKEKYKDTGLKFDCTGPWPPYNFCSINTAKGIDETTSFSSGKEPNGSIIFNGAEDGNAI